MVAKNPYEVAAREVFDLFEEYLEGEFGRPVLVLSSKTLGAQPQRALEKSFATLELGDAAATFGVLDQSIDPHALFLLVEATDPLHVVCTDKASVKRLEEAYRTEFKTNAPMRVFGRPSVAFDDFALLLEDEQNKRTAWELLKTLR